MIGKTIDECGVCGGPGGPCQVDFQKAWVRFLVNNSNALAYKLAVVTTMTPVLSTQLGVDSKFFHISIFDVSNNGVSYLQFITIEFYNVVGNSTTIKCFFFIQ